MVFREFFPRGLTALDNLDEATLGTRPSMSHVTARQEVEALLEALKLPIDERGLRRAAARPEWFAAQDQPLELHDIIASVTRAVRLTRPFALCGRAIAPGARRRTYRAVSRP